MPSTRVSINQAPGLLERAVTVLGDKLSVVLRNLVAKRLTLIIIRRSPVGYPSVNRETGYRKKGTRHPGQFRAGHLLSEGAPLFQDLPDQPSYPIPGAAEIDADLSTMQTPNAPLFISNAVADDGRDSSYAASLEAGRRYNEALGRMLGSEAAPEGIYGPAIEELADHAGQIEAQAVAEIEALL